LWRRTLSHNSLSCQVPSVSSEELALPRLIRCELSQLRCHDHSIFLSSYLWKIKKKENSSSSACGTLCRIWLTSSLTVPPPSLCGALSSAPLLPFLTSGPDLGSWSNVGSPWSSPTPPSLGSDQVAPPPPPSVIWYLKFWTFLKPKTYDANRPNNCYWAYSPFILQVSSILQLL